MLWCDSWFVVWFGVVLWWVGEVCGVRGSRVVEVATCLQHMNQLGAGELLVPSRVKRVEAEAQLSLYPCLAQSSHPRRQLKGGVA